MALAACIASAGQLCAIPLLDPSAPNTMSLYSLGNVADIDGKSGSSFSYQGLAIDNNVLLLSVANGSSPIQTVWALPLVRSSGHIVSFGAPWDYAYVIAANQSSVGNTLAGGLVVTPQGLAYTTQSQSLLGQFGTASYTSSLLDITSTGAVTGGMQNLPGGASGQYKLSSINGQWYTLNTSGAFGSYGIGSFTQYNVGISAYAFDYTNGGASVVLGDANTQRLDMYAVDANGNPCNPTLNVACAPVRHLVTNNLAIGYGVVRDPVTGDILFTTQANDIWVLSEQVPEPATVLLSFAGLGLMAWVSRKRKLRSISLS
jgi:hypothetical protein